MAGYIGGYVDPPAGIIPVGPGAILSGAVGSGKIANNAVVSGSISSGQVGTFHLASGARADRAVEVAPFVQSGSTASILTAELISGFRAVSINQSGQLQIAMASVSGTMPAIGICTGSFLSGTRPFVRLAGPLVQSSSGLVETSGYNGKRLWVGRSGHLVTLSGGFGSGGFLSGDIGQPIGYVVRSGLLLYHVTPLMWSGGPLGIPVGGPY